jgi:hypothetical protein
MDKHLVEAAGTDAGNGFKLLFCLLGCAWPFLATRGEAQERESLAGERAAQALKESAQAEAEQYNLHVGPVGIQIGGGVLFGYTDNVFYSETNRADDFIINPEVTLAAFMQVSELNTLKLSVGVGYEYYLNHSVLNANAPMVNPDSELAFNLFVGNFRMHFQEKFSYQQTLFINSTPSGGLLFNFNDVGTFTRWDNLVGANVDWDLDKLILSAGYNHENFESSTAGFEYLNRASDWFTASASFQIGDQAQVGVESQAGVHNYDSETVLNDHWQVRAGPFVDFKLLEGVSLRGGGGYDTAQYDSAGAGSDFSTYYAYGRVTQQTRQFTHSLGGGRETLLGENANNLQDTFVRYSISSPVVEHVELSANAAVHFDTEYGGAFREEFTYYTVGCGVGYQIHKHWRTQLGYQYMSKDSDLPLRSFHRNLVTVGVNFVF